MKAIQSLCRFISLILIQLIRTRRSKFILQEKLREDLSREFHRSREEVQALARALMVRDLTILENHRQYRMMANEIIAKNNEIVVLQAAATTDALTGLYNRRGAEQELHRVLGMLERQENVHHELSVLVLDLNYFKDVNDRFGHRCGDVALMVIAEHLKQAFRVEDVIIRSGGDEFKAYLVNATREGAIARATTLAALMESDDRLRFDDIHVTVSIGISHGIFATKRGGLQIFETVEQLADAAMYAAKNASRTQTSIVEAPDVVSSDTVHGDL